MIYQKTGTPFPSRFRYNQSFEYMFILSKGKPKTFNPIMKKNKFGGDFRKQTTTRRNEYGIENNIWKIKNGGGVSTKDKIAFKHPAIFPEKLVHKHIISWSNENDLIYDCFMGSGTTAKIAMLNKRNYIGSEISKDYTDLANKRLEQYNKQTNLFWIVF